jgi:hypothetical protein
LVRVFWFWHSLTSVIILITQLSYVHRHFVPMMML